MTTTTTTTNRFSLTATLLCAAVAIGASECGVSPEEQAYEECVQECAVTIETCVDDMLYAYMDQRNYEDLCEDAVDRGEYETLYECYDHYLYDQDGGWLYEYIVLEYGYDDAWCTDKYSVELLEEGVTQGAPESYGSGADYLMSLADDKGEPSDYEACTMECAPPQ